MNQFPIGQLTGKGFDYWSHEKELASFISPVLTTMELHTWWQAQIRSVCLGSPPASTLEKEGVMMPSPKLCSVADDWDRETTPFQQKQQVLFFQQTNIW